MLADKAFFAPESTLQCAGPAVLFARGTCGGDLRLSYPPNSMPILPRPSECASLEHTLTTHPPVMPAKAGTHGKSQLMPLYLERDLKTPCVYILASKPNGVLYTGVTGDLYGRMSDHVLGAYEGFSKRYNVKMLVYYEIHETMDVAFIRETRIKNWKRAWKVRLIHAFNPEWLDLYDRATGEIAPGPADVERERRSRQL